MPTSPYYLPGVPCRTQAVFAIVPVRLMPLLPVRSASCRSLAEDGSKPPHVGSAGARGISLVPVIVFVQIVFFFSARACMRA